MGGALEEIKNIEGGGDEEELHESVVYRNKMPQ